MSDDEGPVWMFFQTLLEVTMHEILSEVVRESPEIRDRIIKKVGERSTKVALGEKDVDDYLKPYLRPTYIDTAEIITIMRNNGNQSKFPLKPVEIPTENKPETNVVPTAKNHIEKRNPDTLVKLGQTENPIKDFHWDYNHLTGSINPHVLIVGETGFGKTHAIKCIISELIKNGMSTIIFDYGSDFQKSKMSNEYIQESQLREIEATKNGISINPLKILSDDVMGPMNVAERMADTFARIYKKIGVQQRCAIFEATETAMKNHGILKSDPDTWNNELPQFDEIHEQLEELSQSDENIMKRPALSAYSHTSSFFKFNVIRDGGTELHWDSAITSKQSWILQLKGLEHKVSMVMTDLLLWNMISYLKDQGQSNQKLFIILDEAHKLSFDEGGPINWLLREGRKFGVGVILASQQLEDYSKVALSNTSTKIIFQNQDNRSNLSKSLAKKCFNIPEYKKISKIITKLEKGVAFVVSENEGNIVKISNGVSKTVLEEKPEDNVNHEEKKESDIIVELIKNRSSKITPMSEKGIISINDKKFHNHDHSVKHWAEFLSTSYQSLAQRIGNGNIKPSMWIEGTPYYSPNSIKKIIKRHNEIVEKKLRENGTLKGNKRKGTIKIPDGYYTQTKAGQILNLSGAWFGNQAKKYGIEPDKRIKHFKLYRMETIEKLRKHIRDDGDTKEVKEPIIDIENSNEEKIEIGDTKNIEKTPNKPKSTPNGVRMTQKELKSTKTKVPISERGIIKIKELRLPTTPISRKKLSTLLNVSVMSLGGFIKRHEIKHSEMKRGKEHFDKETIKKIIETHNKMVMEGKGTCPKFSMEGNHLHACYLELGHEGDHECYPACGVSFKTNKVVY